MQGAGAPTLERLEMRCKVLVLLPQSDWTCGARSWCFYLGVTGDVVLGPGALTLEWLDMWCWALVLLPWSDWRCGARPWCSYLGVTGDVVQGPGALLDILQ